MDVKYFDLRLQQNPLGSPYWDRRTSMGNGMSIKFAYHYDICGVRLFRPGGHDC